MLLVSVLEVQDLFRRLINVRLIVISLLNRLLWRHQFANVDCCGACRVLEVVHEELELVIQVIRVLNGLLERLLLLLLGISGLLFRFFGSSLLLQSSLVGLLVLLDFKRLLLLSGGSFFYLGVVKQPFC